MTTPQQPGHTAAQLDAANDATREAIAQTPNTTRSPARPELSGDSGTRPTRLRLGHRYRPVQTARHDLSRRQLRPHRFHRNDTVDGPGVRHLRRRPRERDPSARRTTDRGAERRGGHRDGPGPTPLRQLPRVYGSSWTWEPPSFPVDNRTANQAIRPFRRAVDRRGRPAHFLGTVCPASLARDAPILSLSSPLVGGGLGTVLGAGLRCSRFCQERFAFRPCVRTVGGGPQTGRCLLSRRAVVVLSASPKVQ